MIMSEVFNEWLKDRPKSIKDLASKLPPNLKYKVKATGQYCDIYSYYEDGTVKVTVTGHESEILDIINKLKPVNVFGLTRDDLEVVS